MAPRIFAVIEVGSFEIEMGSYEPSPKYGLREIDHLRHMIALGNDTYRTGKISYGLVDELCQVLTEFSAIMKTYQVEAYRAYGTTAMREAKNKKIILEQIRVRTGIKVRIISNSEHRFLTYKAIAMKEVEFQKIIQKGTAIADAGFGSLQLSLFDKDSLMSTQNISLGVLALREVVTRTQTDRATARAMIEETVANELFTYKKLYLKDRDIKHLIGIGDCMLYLARGAGEGRRLDRITREEFHVFFEKMMALSLPQIQDIFEVSEAFAQLLFASAILYKEILDLTGAEMVWIPGVRLCDGMAAEYAESVGALRFTHNFDNDILMASRNMAKRYRCVNTHSQCVESHVLKIFDAMKKYHGFKNRERLLLQIATVLHGCGKFISMANSSQCAYNIVMSTEIIGLSHQEREMIAHVVQYNLERFDYDKTSTMVAKLTAMLRLANAMDRGHRQKLEDCRMTVRDGQLIITTSYQGDLTLEQMEVQKKAVFFEEIFGIRPVLKQKRRV